VKIEGNRISKKCSVCPSFETEQTLRSFEVEFFGICFAKGKYKTLLKNRVLGKRLHFSSFSVKFLTFSGTLNWFLSLDKFIEKKKISFNNNWIETTFFIWRFLWHFITLTFFASFWLKRIKVKWFFLQSLDWENYRIKGMVQLVW